MKKVFAALMLIQMVSSCNSSEKGKEKDKANYEKSKESMAALEMKNPVQYLTVKAKDKRNLIGQTVVRGTLTNRAKITTYYDVVLERSFFSKTGALLEKDEETIYERLAPGAQVEFKSKLFAPKGSDSVELKILQAKAEKQ